LWKNDVLAILSTVHNVGCCGTPPFIKPSKYGVFAEKMRKYIESFIDR